MALAADGVTVMQGLQEKRTKAITITSNKLREPSRQI